MTTAPGDVQQENEELMRRYLNYINDARLGVDADAVLGFMHPDVEWRPGLLAHGQEIYRGRDEYRTYIEQTLNVSGEGGYLNVAEIRPVGEDRVLVLAWVHYRARDDSATFDGEYALLARIEDGLFRDLRSFLRHADAEQAAADA